MVATILWIFSAALGLVAMLQVYEAVRAASAIVVPIDPMQTIVSQGLVVFVSRVALVLLAIGWLIGAILLLDHYLRSAKLSMKHLAMGFLIATILEVASMILATFAVRRLLGVSSWHLPFTSFVHSLD